MRETILASNLIRKLNFMSSVALAICLGLLPSQVFATAQTCETYPDCTDLGYTQTSCNENSISLKCPFDNSKLFCVECTPDQIYNSANNKCEDGKTYCANQSKEFDGGECVSCAANETFDMTTMKCVNKCVAGGYNAQVPSNNVCIRTQYSGETCYTNCVKTSNCENFTGYVDTSGKTVTSDNSGTLGLVRDNVYYKPLIKVLSGNFNYNYAEGTASGSGGVLPKQEELSIINGLSQDGTAFSSLTYWTSIDCSDSGQGDYVVNRAGCKYRSEQAATSVVILKKCNSE